MSQEQADKPVEEPKKEEDHSPPQEDRDNQAQDSAAPGEDKTRPTAPFNVSEAGGPLPELDEGPRPSPVDDIQAALFEAAQEGVSTEVNINDLPEPVPDLDEGPRPRPVDEVQEALFEAAQQGAPADVDFDQLPEPGLPKPQKVVKFKKKAAPSAAESPAPTAAPTETTSSPETVSEPIPLPEFPEPDPVPTVSDFWLLLALFLSFRLLTLFLLRPGGFIRDWSDFDTYFGIAALSDYSLYPFLNFWLEWPPLVPWLTVITYKLSLLFPPWPDDPRLWFILFLGGIFVLFEVGNFFLIYRLARRLFQSTVTINRVLWMYAGLFPPVYAMLGFFDGIALFFLLLALDLLLRERRFSSAVAVGIGLMVKIIPVLMLPVALRRLWYQYRENNREASIEIGLYSVIFGLTALVLLLPFIVAGPEWVLASIRSILGRSSWETVWAIIEGYYGFGVVLGDRLNPAETDFAVHEGFLPWGVITLVFIGIYAFIFTRPADYNRPRNMVAFSGLTVALFMLYTKGYSPQFLVYLLPFILLLFPDGRGLIYALILTSLNVLEQPVYFVLIPEATWLLSFVIITRFIIIALLSLEFAIILWPLEQRLAPIISLRRPLPSILAGLASLSLLLLLPLIVHAYRIERLQAGSLFTLVGFMEIQAETQEDSLASNPRLLLSDQATYRQLYPYLHQKLDLKLANGAATYEAAPTMPELLNGLDTVWILPTGPQQQSLYNSVNNRGQLLASFDFEDIGTASLYGFQPNLPPFVAPARFSTGIELLANEVEVEPGSVEVTLYWRARNPQTQSLTAFTQLLNADGQQVAGHDSIPANGSAPTTAWTIDVVQADSHTLELPADLPPGEYTLIVGLYNRFQERIHAIGPDGLSFTNRAVPLQTLQLP